jgi:hypothetical protein
MTKKQALQLAGARWPGYCIVAKICRTGDHRFEITAGGTPGGWYESKKGDGRTMGEALARLGCQRCNPEWCILLLPHGAPCDDCWLKGHATPLR